jgi:hypothetical protein
MLKSFFRHFLPGVAIFVFCNSAYSKDLNSVYHQLKSENVDYVPLGSVCEQVARLKLQEKYPEPHFEVKTNIGYGENSHQIGELDVVVFEEPQEVAVLIGEVKCWHNLESALEKAEKQRERFKKSIKRAGRLDFFSMTDHLIHYSPKKFEGNPEFITIAPEGGDQAGFDLALEYTLEELLELRSMLLNPKDVRSKL